MIPVILDRPSEILAATVGLRRTVENAFKVDQSFQKVNFFESIARDGEAAGAELALAQYFGLDDFELSVNTFKNQADMGSRIECKWTRWQDGHLIIKESDRNQDIAVLVVGQSPTYYVVGWIPVAIAKKDRFKHEKSNSWWVSQVNLRPIETFQRSQDAHSKL
jgi:hypothetical protein